MDNFKQNRIKKIELASGILIGIIIIGFIAYVIYQRENVIAGMLRIITSPAVLITDFLVIGGIGAVFLNAFLILIFNLTLTKLLKVEINGLVIACFFYSFRLFIFWKKHFKCTSLLSWRNTL